MVILGGAPPALTVRNGVYKGREMPANEGIDVHPVHPRGRQYNSAPWAFPERALQSKDLFDSWERLAGQVSAAARLTLFLDFDGTLAPFRLRPDRVRLAHSTRRVLERLARHPKNTIWIISGRRSADVRLRAGVGGIHYLGMHGWEDEDRPLRLGPAQRKHLRAARERFADQLQGLRGLWIEDKQFSFTIHYRGAPPALVRRAQGMVCNVLDGFQPHLRRLAGNSAWEILPTIAGDKGVAVRRVLRRLGGSPLVIYVGDDGTDELAFAALPRGLTICVAPGRDTRAKFAVRSTTEVRRFLRMLLKELSA